MQHSASASRTFRHPQLLSAFHAHAPFATTGPGDDSTLRLRGTLKRKAPRRVSSSESLWLPGSVSKPAHPRESVGPGAVADVVVITNNTSVDPGGKRQRVVRRRQSKSARSKLIENLKVIKHLRVRSRDVICIAVVLIVAVVGGLVVAAVVAVVADDVNDVLSKNTYVPREGT